LKVFLAVNHPEIESVFEKLESEKGIKELEKSIGVEGLSRWAGPLLIADQAMYRERLVEKAKAAEPDVVILYDKLPGLIDLDILLEEIRLEVKNSAQKDTRIIFLTSLEQGAPLLRKAVELGVWDIVSGKDILLIDLIKSIYQPANYSDVAHFRLASDNKSQVKFIPRYVEKEKIVEVPVEVKVKEIVEKTEYVRVGTISGNRETVLIWSPLESGKTFLSVNIAVALAKMGLRTVLIDADTTNRSVENYFLQAKEEKYGFIKALKNHYAAEEIFHECHIYKKNLTVLTLPSGRAELPEVSREDFIYLYETLRSCCDIFIIDGCKDIGSIMTRTAVDLASKVLVPVSLDPNRARLMKAALNSLDHSISLGKFELLLNMYISAGLPRAQDISEIIGLKLLPVNITAAVASAYRSIVEGIPAYDGGYTPESFIHAINELANYLNEGDPRGRTANFRKKKLFGFGK